MTVLQRIATRLRFGVYAPLRLNRFPSYHLSCSQFGEDMIVRHLLEDVRTGFYVDVGAHHPVYYSNTYHFYRRGWRGINVDAIPGSMNAFRLLRPRDVNVEACVDAVAGVSREFFVFDSPALNTASPDEAAEVQRSGRGRVVARHRLTTTTLTDLLDRHLPPGRPIDFLTIDVEGMDEVILRHHDFARYRPRVLVFERKGCDAAAVGVDSLVAYLKNVGYAPVAYSGASLVMHIAPGPTY